MKVILHGGYPSTWPEEKEDPTMANRLAQEAMATDQKLLVCYLAYESLTEVPWIDAVKKYYLSLAPNITVNFAARENFEELFFDHQIVLLQGDESIAQSQFFEKFTREQLIKNKRLIAGTSAGANILCNWGYTQGGDEIPLKGRGIVNLSIIPHANCWPIERYLPRLKEKTLGSIILLNETETVEVEVPTI